MTLNAISPEDLISIRGVQTQSFRDEEIARIRMGASEIEVEVVERAQ